jgi:hypothetical protein
MDDKKPALRVEELYAKRQSRDTARLKAYNQILLQIHHRVRMMSRLPNNQCYLIYTIPPFILGLPKIDMEDCVVYIVYQLRMEGFDVRYTFPNMLYISWKHHEREYILEQSPILQAMLESTEEAKREAERKKEKEESLRKTLMGGGSKGGKKGGGQRGGVSSSSGDRKVAWGGVVTAVTEERKAVAGQYEPPVSFLRKMDGNTAREEAQQRRSNFVDMPSVNPVFKDLSNF